MKSILKKTTGILVCLLFLPLINVAIEFTISSNPNLIKAIIEGFVLTATIGICGFIGWYVGKFVFWCFN